MKYKFKKEILAVAVGLSTYCGLAVADTGGLRISVTDSEGNPVPGAEVTVNSPESLGGKEGITDEDGHLRVMGLDPSAKYIVEINGDGYQTLRSRDVLVVSGQNFALNYSMNEVGESIEEVLVTGRPVQLVDSTSTIVGQDITLDLTESLPTGRDYQSYLQLAPGTKPSKQGNPSSKSGVNYSDIGGEYGNSSDNVYYIDGVNITDNNSGLHGAGFNSEIIQEQHVLTGGVPAEYAGGAGLISRVVTKSGGNDFEGSVNYYTQNDNLVGSHDHLDDSSFSTFDSAVTFGGPIIQDKLWFYTSYQVKNREEDVANSDTGEKMRTVNRDEEFGFAKLTWQISDRDRLMAEFFNDPYDRDGSMDPSVLTNRDYARKEGGDNYQVEYSHSWNDLIFTLNAASHEGEWSTIAADKSTNNDVAYLGYEPTNEEQNMGGLGYDTIRFSNKDTWSATFEYFLDTKWGSHQLKAGYTNTVNEYKTNEVYNGDGSQYTSIGAINSGATFSEYVNNKWTGSKSLTNDDSARIISAMEGSEDSAYYLGILDSNNDGSISSTELDNLTFSSTNGNPHEMVNVYRITQVQQAPVSLEAKGDAFFVQDAWTLDQWTINAGLRAETWEHFASDGSSIYKFDTEIAPRLGVSYDITGDGSQKVWGFYGRYYDPIRTNMTSFAGTLTGSIRDEQVFVGDRWLTYRTRGGSQTQDALFAPTTKTPYTDEYMLGYAWAFRDDMSFEVTYTDRATKDILEDYDLGVYTDPDKVGDFVLPLSYFGYDSIPDSNYVIATLEGGKREYQGLEFTFRKRRSDNWQMLASYTYNQAKGNTNSDSNADIQGDLLKYDPRAPGMWGDQPGNIEHLLKMAGSYHWDNGLELGLVYNWNSGTLYNRAEDVYGRHLQVSGDAFEYGGINEAWVDGGALASENTGSYGTLDARLKYTLAFGDYSAEFFLDIFNVLDDQASIQAQALELGGDGYDFGESMDWVEPRRFYLGTRVSF